MSFSIKKLLGLSTEPPLTEAENHLFTQLQVNRKIALAEIIPDNMMIQFLTDNFPNRNLMSITKKTYRSKSVGDKEDFRRAYLEELVQSCLSINRFGRKLIAHHGIDPKTVVNIMLRDIHL